MAIQTYDPSQLAVSIGPALLTGFADGSFIKVTPNSDRYKKSVGATGDVTRVAIADRSGQVSITLMKESPSNAALRLLASAGSSSDIYPFMLKNLLSLDTVTAKECWIMAIPEDGYSTDGDTLEWKIECADISMFLGDV